MNSVQHNMQEQVVWNEVPLLPYGGERQGMLWYFKAVVINFIQPVELNVFKLRAPALLKSNLIHEFSRKWRRHVTF